ncbi:MAG: IS110 family transposase [Methylococcales symbiont of Iophon sp. n. MRB-2018]|nr:MAG: IS110 family transposase [Methylococcales symbiont of Iophon sp. n. MRB-2018]KAF3979859.1 MAG: IS110 family transposase [Methylococcales symbiont of Iophon sp. n. MRB-2018]
MTNIADTFNIVLEVSFNTNKTARYTNDINGFKQLLNPILDKKRVGVAMESTRGYERPLVGFIQDKGVAVSVVNAKRIRDYACYSSFFRSSLGYDC